jgi:hypothetical protein
MEMQHVVARLAADKAIKSKANHGVKYRTLCARCNNALLGGRYDPALINFVNQVSRLLASSLSLPTTIPVPAQPDLIIRSVWGHLAAVGVDRYLKGPDTEAWRDWFLDDAATVPAGAKFYYWLYPYRRQVLMRDAGVTNLRDHTQALFWAMKFYPLAFAVWMPAKGAPEMPMRDFGYYRTSNPDDVVDVLIDMLPVPHELTLEAPDGDFQAIMVGRDAIVADARPPRGYVLPIT